MIDIVPTSARPPPAVKGFEATDEIWRFDPQRYAPFIETATGISITEPLSAADCYRIGNRLEALIDERHRHDAWSSEIVEEYPVVETRAEIVGLVRLFRECHTYCLEAENSPCRVETTALCGKS